VLSHISPQHFTHDFLNLSVLRSFTLIIIRLCDFWQKNIGAKAVHKMLMKLTAVGVNFINILQAAFSHADPESAKNVTVWSALLFYAFGTYKRKSCS
jgi:hypothetical protein